MITKANISLDLTDKEKKNFRKHKIKKAEVLEYAPDELEVLLEVSKDRATKLYASADFQRIPSIGIEFVKDLIFLGYHEVDELIGQNGAELTNQYEVKKGYQTDPCVEDQFRLAVHFAENRDSTKKWWNFTNERKSFRSKNGYPDDRPKTHWTQVTK